MAKNRNEAMPRSYTTVWQLPVIVTLVVVFAALAAIPHRELDLQGTVIPLAQKYYGITDTNNTEPLRGKIVVVTGCTSGIGLSLTKTLSKLGATVVGIGRSASKLDHLKEQLDTLEPFVADLTDLVSVSKAADEILAKYDHIDILINNAEKLSAALHHNATQRPTIVQIASSFHYSVDGSDLKSTADKRRAEGDGTPVAARKGGNPGLGGLLRSSRSYSNSKLAQILHARALRRHHPLWNKSSSSSSSKARIVSVCPGLVGTNIGGSEFNWALDLGFPVDGWGIATPLMAIFMDNEDGDYFTSATIFDAATLVNYLQHPLWYRSGLRDAIVWVFVFIVGALQGATARVRSHPSSIESYDENLGDSLYHWSLQAIQEFL